MPATTDKLVYYVQLSDPHVVLKPITGEVPSQNALLLEVKQHMHFIPGTKQLVLYKVSAKLLRKKGEVIQKECVFRAKSLDNLLALVTKKLQERYLPNRDAA